MTIKTACQSALLRLIGNRPDTIFGSPDPTVVEIADLANEVAIDIARSHDWQALTAIETFDGDGTITDFPMPADYDRMAQGSDMHDPALWFWGYSHIPDVNDWIAYTARGLALTPGGWTILNNAFRFFPAPSGLARFPYIRNTIVRSGQGVPKTSFDADTDSFVLDERLLTLGLVWRWRAQKRLEYAEDMQSYGIALSERQAKDRGARTIRKGVPGTPGNTRIAWPWELG